MHDNYKDLRAILNNQNKEPEAGDIWITDEPGFEYGGRMVVINKAITEDIFEVIPLSFDIDYARDYDIVKIDPPQYFFETWNITYCPKSVLKSWRDIISVEVLEKINQYINDDNDDLEFQHPGFEIASGTINPMFRIEEQESIKYMSKPIIISIAIVKMFGKYLNTQYLNRLKEISKASKIYRSAEQSLIKTIEYQSKYGLLTVELLLDPSEQKVYFGFDINNKKDSLVISVLNDHHIQLDIINIDNGVGQSKTGFNNGLYHILIEDINSGESDKFLIKIE